MSTTRLSLKDLYDHQLRAGYMCALPAGLGYDLLGRTLAACQVSLPRGSQPTQTVSRTDIRSLGSRASEQACGSQSAAPPDLERYRTPSHSDCALPIRRRCDRKIKNVQYRRREKIVRARTSEIRVREPAPRIQTCRRLSWANPAHCYSDAG